MYGSVDFIRKQAVMRPAYPPWLPPRVVL